MKKTGRGRGQTSCRKWCCLNDLTPRKTRRHETSTTGKQRDTLVNMDRLICLRWVNTSSFCNHRISEGYLVIWSGRRRQGAQGVFAAGMAGSSWHRMAWGGSLPLCGARWNVPVINTSHVCHHLPSWRQIRVCLKWLLPPDICKCKYTRSGVVLTKISKTPTSGRYDQNLVWRHE